MAPKFPLSIGSVTFDQNPFEGPNADTTALGDLGSTQKAVVRELPGGIVSAQLLGSFPKPISWTGILWGSNAQSRSAQLQQLCDDGDRQTLTWAQWSFDGFVADYECFPHSTKEIHFKITFRPVVNNNSSSGSNSGGSSNSGSIVISNAQQTMLQQANSPASGATLSDSITNAISTLNDLINQALKNSGGDASAIGGSDLQTIQNQISSVQQQLSPLVSGSDPIQSSAAADLNGTVSIISSTLGDASTDTATEFKAVNPDVYQLAARYLGDPTQYQAILDASGLTDPFPVGEVTIKIPNSVPTTVKPTTVMNDGLAA